MVTLDNQHLWEKLPPPLQETIITWLGYIDRQAMRNELRLSDPDLLLFCHIMAKELKHREEFGRKNRFVGTRRQLPGEFENAISDYLEENNWSIKLPELKDHLKSTGFHNPQQEIVQILKKHGLESKSFGNERRWVAPQRMQHEVEKQFGYHKEQISLDDMEL